jgi:hypothetical protein
MLLRLSVDGGAGAGNHDGTDEGQAEDEQDENEALLRHQGILRIEQHG